MATLRYPILVLNDHAGLVTACWAERPEVAAVAPSEAEAVAEVEACLKRRLREMPWTAQTDLEDPSLLEIGVTLRPEHREGDKVYAASDTLRAQVACVFGRRQSGLLGATVPLLGLSFDYHEGETLKPLVVHYVEQALKGSSPERLARHLRAGEPSLRALVLRSRAPRLRLDALEDIETLREVCEPLASGTRQRAFGREREVERLAERLAEPRAALVLVGEAGVGKSTVLLEAARLAEVRAKATRGEGRPPRFWLTSAGRLIAGMRYLGQWEARVEQIARELDDIEGVLVCERLVDLVRLGGRGPGDSVAAFLGGFLEHGGLRLVAEATPRELDACRRMLPGFTELLEVFEVPELDPAGARAVLARIAEQLGQRRAVRATRDVPDATHRLFRRFQPQASFPGPAARFLRRLFEAARGGSRELDERATVRRFVHETGLPEAIVRDDIPLAHAEVERALAAEVIGQDAACQSVADAITGFKAGVNDPARPVAVLLFCGPTGVGKTRLAQVTARFLFGHGEEAERRLVRIDMSEYGAPGSAARLVARPDGSPSDLVRRLAAQPFSVVLLDEVEKADAEVFDLLLSVLDEGRLTDPFGRVTSFKSAVLVLTSNLGAGSGPSLGFHPDEAPAFAEEVRRFFRPELFNRIDEVVPFVALSKDAVLRITRLELEQVARREGLARRGLRLVVADRLARALAEAGFDARYGARPLVRTIEERLVAPLSRHLVERPTLRDAELVADLGADGMAAF